jgi:serine-type D-Ala-D-Ala carboxypeptidase (penicillin-binding protein 5/6)
VAASRLRIAAFACAALLCVALLPSAAAAATPSKPSVNVPAATMYTIDGQRLWVRNPSTKRHVASTIKMLNALVVREQADLDRIVTIPKDAAETEDGVGLVKGQRVTVRKLMQLMMVCSANDAASALAIRVSGSEKKHVSLMNAKAKELGLTRTHAVDPHGLSKKEVSTARDLAILGRAVMADTWLRKTVRMRSVVLTRPHRKPKRIEATNDMLGHYRGIEGVKTGFTYAAGYCFVGAAKRGNLELVGVVLGAKSNDGRFAEMRKLLNWGFNRYYMKRLVSMTDTMPVVTVEASENTTVGVTVHAEQDVSRAVVKGYRVEKSVTLPETMPVVMAAHIKRGDQVGYLRFKQLDKTLVTVKLLADSDFPTATIKPRSSVVPSPSPVASAPASQPGGSTLWARLAGLPRRVLVALASPL